MVLAVFYRCNLRVTSVHSVYMYGRCATGTVVPGSEKVGTVCNTLIEAVNLCVSTCVDG